MREVALVPIAAPAGLNLRAIQELVLNSVSSPLTRLAYARALGGFFRWRESQSGLPFTRSTVQAHRAHLESLGLAPATINQRLAALRKLAQEAAANGWLDAETAASINQVSGVKQSGTQAGNWLTKAQVRALLHAPDPNTLKGKRDRALLAVLVGCALRRSEVSTLTVEHLQQRDGRWVMVDLRGKHGRIRSVAVPGWVKQAIDPWLEAAGISEGSLFRSMNRHGQITGESLSGQGILKAVGVYASPLKLVTKPHDLRRTSAKLCRASGADLEQIQLLLGHASIQTTERYLGTRQNLADAPNDHLGLKWD